MNLPSILLRKPLSFRQSPNVMSLNLSLCISGSSPQTFYSLDVIASDGGLPSLTDVTTVQINVTRNNNRPVWRVSNNANITILETQPLSDSIGSVSGQYACLLMLSQCYFLLHLMIAARWLYPTNGRPYNSFPCVFFRTSDLDYTLSQLYT